MVVYIPPLVVFVFVSVVAAAAVPYKLFILVGEGGGVQ